MTPERHNTCISGDERGGEGVWGEDILPPRVRGARIFLHPLPLPLPLLLRCLSELLLWQVSQCDSSDMGQPPQLPKCQPISQQTQSPLL